MNGLLIKKAMERRSILSRYERSYNRKCRATIILFSNVISMTGDKVMDENNKIQLFEDKRIRTAWDEEEQEWYFSVVDVVSILTDQATPRSASTYWAVLKKRLIEEGAQLLTNCKQLKMKAADGKKRLNDVANKEQLLRII